MALLPFGSAPAINATSSTPGKVQLTGDLGGTATSPQVVATHLASPLPASQGGTGVANNAASTLTISGNFATTLTVSNTTSLTLPTSGTVTALGNTTTGSGNIVLTTSPTLTTPVLGVATATTINKVTLTTPATGSTLTVADGKTLTANNSLTLAGTDSTTMTFPSSSDTVVTLGATQTLTSKTTTGLALTAGTTGVAPLNFNSGTNLTSATAGTMEYDGTVHYSTHATSERGVLSSEQFVALSSPYTVTSQTAAQQLFNGTANGAVTLAGTTSYQFECFFTLTSLSSTSGTFSFGFAVGGSLTSILWNSIAIKPSTIGSGANGNVTAVAAATVTAITAANTNTTGVAWVRGLLRSNASGTLTPQLAMSQASAAVVSANSYFRIWPVGSGSVVTVGNWS